MLLYLVAGALAGAAATLMVVGHLLPPRTDHTSPFADIEAAHLALDECRMPRNAFGRPLTLPERCSILGASWLTEVERVRHLDRKLAGKDPVAAAERILLEGGGRRG